MRDYLIRRLVQFVPVLLGIGLVTFLIVRAAPGDPVTMLVDVNLLSQEEVARFREDLGLNASLPVQFVTLLKELATGSIHSFRTGQPVLSILAQRIPITAVLLGGAIALSLLLGVPLGVMSARSLGSRLDNWLTIAALWGISLPGFWFALVLMWLFAGILHVLPASGTGPATRLTYGVLDMVPYFVLPIVVLASGLLPPIVRYTRSSMLDDNTYQPKPDLAESWTVSKDGLEYVFKLRRGVVFHDGSPFTAHDVKFSWEVICHRDNPRIADAYVDHYIQIKGCRDFHEGKAPGVDGIEVVDDHTLRVKLVEPYAPFLVSTAVTGILPRAKYGAIPVKALSQHPLSRSPVGTGPFSFVDWKEGDRVVLKANPRYFLGRPKLDGLIIRFIEDPAARLIEFKNGALHFAFFAPVLPEDFNAAKSDPRLMAKAYGGVWNYFFAVDHTNPLFKDARVRQAISLAFDRPRILAEHWGGYGIVANSPINPSLPAFDKKVAAPEYDPGRAKALLAEAGWRPGADGIMQKDGKRFEFGIINFPGASRTMAIVYQDALKKIGLDARVETIDFPTLWGVRFHPGKFEALSFMWPSGFYPDPGVGLYPFLCANSRSGYCSAELDRLIVAGRSTVDPKERIRVYARFQQLFERDQPFMWVVSPADLRLASAKLILPERANDFLVMKAILDWDMKE